MWIPKGLVLMRGQRLFEAQCLLQEIQHVSLPASRTLLQRLLACLNYTLDFYDMTSSTSSSKPWRWVRLDLILSIRDIYINSNLTPLTKFTSSSRSTEFKDILSCNISQVISKTVLISKRIIVSIAMKQSILLWIW